MAVVDLDAFDANADDLVRRAAGKPIRVATKSLRVPALIERVLARPEFAGTLGYTLAEALWLVENHVSDDVVVAYPTADVGAIARLTASGEAAHAITLMVDRRDQIDLIDAARSSDLEVRLCLDVDAGLHVAGKRVGPLRSALMNADAAAQLARHIAQRPGFHLVGVMTYEGQVAGMQDAVPHAKLMSLGIRGVKKASIRQLASRRAQVLAAIRPFADLEFWNGGGSGSVESTVQDPVVSEVAAGSGLLVPTLFDHYRSFTARPAAFFALPVTRRPDAVTATVHGGGLIASGPTGPERAPTPFHPTGLALTGLEGAGEVQTPLTGEAAARLRIGDLVWFRHAKSGELFEHTTTAHLLQGDAFVDHAPTYRGQGQSF